MAFELPLLLRLGEALLASSDLEKFREWHLKHLGYLEDRHDILAADA
jgi:hypothetical protein